MVKINTDSTFIDRPIVKGDVTVRDTDGDLRADVATVRVDVNADGLKDSMEFNLREAGDVTQFKSMLKASGLDLNQVTKLDVTAEQRAELSAMSKSLTVGNPIAVKPRWEQFVTDLSVGAEGLDINAIIQHVLRESYLETNKDLQFYADKVKYFNELKKNIRDELTKAREAFAQFMKQNPDAKAGTPVDPPYVARDTLPTFPDTTMLGSPQRDANGNTVSIGSAQDAFVNHGGGGITQVSQSPPTYKTAAGWTISINEQYGVQIKNPQNQVVTQIWGDPHVDEAAVNGFTGRQVDWDFKHGASFVLPDGTKLSLETQPYGGAAAVTSAVHIQSGNSVASITGVATGAATAGAVTADRQAFDKGFNDGTVFALAADGQWAQAKSGQWFDITGGSASTGEIYTAGSAKGMPAQDAALAALVANGSVVKGADGKYTSVKAIGSKKEFEAYIDSLEQKLSSVGDDAQLANIDLQNKLQQQQQTLQTISNVSKMLHDTAMAIIRKVG